MQINACRSVFDLRAFEKYQCYYCRQDSFAKGSDEKGENMPTIVGSIIAIVAIVALVIGCVHVIRHSGGCIGCSGNCADGSCCTEEKKG